MHTARPDADTFDTEVAVVGAGPIGLLAATQLAARGIRVCVIEQLHEQATLPKANGIVGRAAVELHRRGILAGTGLRPLSAPQFQFGPITLMLGHGPGNPLHILPVPQRRLEGLLQTRAVRDGAAVRRGLRVTTVTQNDDTVTLTCDAGPADDGDTSPDPAGADSVSTRDTMPTDDTAMPTGPRELRARYVIGCDGARSVVRKQLGIGFPGVTSDGIARIARVTIPPESIRVSEDGIRIEGIPPLAPMRMNVLPGGGFSIAPAAALDRTAPKDLYIISTHEPRGDAEPTDRLPTAELRASLRRVLGGDLPFTDADSVRSTVGNSRHAETYRVGRAFLAGDAAHVFSAGGAGLNAGIMDALDLTDRLADVLRGGADPTRLDGYDAQRRAAGDRILTHTRAQAALSAPGEGSAALRDVIGTLASHRATARRLAAMIEDA